MRARLAGQLVDLAERGHDTPDGHELSFLVTHQELAALIGTTRETVSLELGRLERSRLIVRRGRQILPCDVPRLRALARDDPPVRRSSWARDSVAPTGLVGAQLPVTSAAPIAP